MKNMKKYYKLLKMMFINNYCTDFMFQEAMMCETCSPSILSLIISNFILVFKISQKFVEMYVKTGFNYEIYL